MRAFIDTGAWAALYNQNDHYHARAAKLWKQALAERGSLFTSNYVVAETVVLLRVRSGHAAAVRFGEDMFSSQVVRLLHLPPPLEKAAWEIFKKYDDQDFSFTDCTSFAVMRDLRLTQAFTFDKHFAAFGFQALPTE